MSSAVDLQSPDEIVFDGQLYFTTAIHKELTGGLRILQVVEIDSAGQEGDDPEENGPLHVVFNQFIYQKTDRDPALIEDNVLRVAAEESVANQALLQLGKSQSRTLPVAAHMVAVQYKNEFAPRLARLISEARPQLVHNGLLPLGFDLPTNSPRPEFILPTLHNLPITCEHAAGSCFCQKRRVRWSDEHRDYLFYLVGLALIFLNRELRLGDFKAITEAMTRQFHGTNLPFPERGYSSVHSFATKKCSPSYPEYEALLNRIVLQHQSTTDRSIETAISTDSPV